MQPLRSTATNTPTPRIQAAANEPMGDRDSILCQLRFFGRTVSLSKATAVYLAAGLPVGLSVAMTVTLAGTFALSSIPGAFTAFASGGFAGNISGCIAQSVYLRCRHAAPAEPSVQLSRVICHAPAVAINDAITFRYPQQPPPYIPEDPRELPPPYESPPPYSPQESPEQQLAGTVDPPPPYSP